MSTIHDMHTQHFGGEDTETVRVECMERAAPVMLAALKNAVARPLSTFVITSKPHWTKARRSTKAHGWINSRSPMVTCLQPSS